MTLEEIVSIVKPHNDRIVAEADAGRLQRQNARLLEALNEIRMKAQNAKLEAAKAQRAAELARIYAIDCEAIADACLEAMTSTDGTD